MRSRLVASAATALTSVAVVTTLAQPAQATNRGYLVAKSTMAECRAVHSAVLQDVMRNGWQIRSVRYCYRAYAGSYQGNVQWDDGVRTK